MWKSNFLNQKVLAISKVKNSPFTFSKPAPEASPVLTLGISSKGQVRTSILYTKMLPGTNSRFYREIYSFN